MKMILSIFPFFLLILKVQSQLKTTEPSEESLLGLCKPIACIPVECGPGFKEFRKGCDCAVCVSDDPSQENLALGRPDRPTPKPNPSVESAQCPPCRTECAPGTRLVQSPTRCSNPRCVANGIPDEWENPRPDGIDGLCLQRPDVPVDCGNGTQLVQDKSQCGCGRCVPINPSVESAQCPPCRTECAPGTRLVEDPTRCHQPRCVANGIPDEWEKPRQPGIVGLCLQPPNVPVKCGNGTRLEQDNRRCSCGKCVPINEQESCPPCKVTCAPGTRLVQDPTRCHSPRCVADGIEDEWEKPRPPGIVGLCFQPPDVPVECGKGTKKVREVGHCKCHKCVPTTQSPHPESLFPSTFHCKPIACPQVLCAVGTHRVNDPRGCSCPKCVPDHDCSSVPVPCKPIACPAVICPLNTIRFEDPQGCRCPICHPLLALQSLSDESIFDGIQCKFICPPVTCPEGQMPQRDHQYVCSCPRCQPSVESALDIDIPGAICNIACPALSCGPNHHPVRRPGICSCPRCEPNPIRPSCTPVVCPAVACPPDSIVVEDPEGCRCPVCHPRPSLESFHIDFSKIVCKHICPRLNCPAGESPQRDHRYVCACPQCTPDNQPTTLFAVSADVICDFACPKLQCPVGEAPTRDPSVKCGCPTCKPVHTCKPLLCPQVQCQEGEFRFQDPEGCRCPICYRKTVESAQANQFLQLQCKFICQPLTCPPGQTPKRDHRYTCGCPRCVSDDDLTVLESLEGSSSDMACSPCPAGSFPFRNPGMKMGCPICINLDVGKNITTMRGGP